MTIIEKEIERREGIIIETARKVETVERFKAEIERLTAEIESTDTVLLQAEIDELRAYLPRDPEATDESHEPFGV